MLRLRALQDETGGFQTFIPLAFHPDNNALMKLPGPTGVDDLRTYAVARLMLDNIPHIKAYWIMLGVKTAQIALWFGADDLDGTVQEEKIYHMAGAETPQAMSPAELVRIIREAGRMPVERDTLYNVVAEGAALAPDKPFRRDVRRQPGGRVVSKLRIAAVSFLNARPITYGLERGLGSDRFELSFELPSRCAELLERGDVDLGLVPERRATRPRSGEMRIVPGIAIAGLRPGAHRAARRRGAVGGDARHRARRRVAQLGDAAAAAVPRARARAAVPRAARTTRSSTPRRARPARW